jgi:hypothetical protein
LKSPPVTTAGQQPLPLLLPGAAARPVPSAFPPLPLVPPLLLPLLSQLLLPLLPLLLPADPQPSAPSQRLKQAS